MQNNGSWVETNRFISSLHHHCKKVIIIFHTPFYTSINMRCRTIFNEISILCKCGNARSKLAGYTLLCILAVFSYSTPQHYFSKCSFCSERNGFNFDGYGHGHGHLAEFSESLSTHQPNFERKRFNFPKTKRKI